jgi:hypothetical protein
MYQKVECVCIACDNCDEIFQDSSTDFSIFLDEGSARDYCVNHENGWTEHEGKHYCPDCHEIDEEDNFILKPKPNSDIPDAVCDAKQSPIVIPKLSTKK